MATKVTNVQIWQALNSLGVLGDFTGPFDTRGAQHGEFKNRIMDLLRARAGNQPQDRQPLDWFNLAEKVAGWKPDPSKSAQDNFMDSLAVRGIESNQLNRIRQEAQQQGGGEVAFYQKAADILGQASPTLVGAYDQNNITWRPQPYVQPQGGPAPYVPPGEGGRLPPPTITTPPGPNTAIIPAPIIPKKGAKPGTPGGPPIPDNQLPPAMTPAQAEQYVNQHYGFMGVLMQDPEIHKLLVDNAERPMSQQEYDARFMGTQWAQHHNDAQQAWVTLASTKPEQAQKQVSDTADNYVTWATAMGFKLDPGRAKELATLSWANGLDDSAQRHGLAAEYHYQTGVSPDVGIAGALKTHASDFLLPMSDDTINRWGQSIVGGDSTTDDFRDYARSMAKAKYSGIAGWLDKDPKRTVKMFVDPYIQTAASTLEMSPDVIDPTDSKFSAMFGKPDPKTGETSVMTGPEWDQYLRGLPEWQKTKNARETVDKFSEEVLKRFGAVA